MRICLGLGGFWWGKSGGFYRIWVLDRDWRVSGLLEEFEDFRAGKFEIWGILSCLKTTLPQDRDYIGVEGSRLAILNALQDFHRVKTINLRNTWPVSRQIKPEREQKNCKNLQLQTSNWKPKSSTPTSWVPCRAQLTLLNICSIRKAHQKVFSPKFPDAAENFQNENFSISSDDFPQAPHRVCFSSALHFTSSLHKQFFFFLSANIFSENET